MKSGNNKEAVLFRDASRLVAGPELMAFLDQACKGDSALRKRLEALLRANENPHPALECLTDVAAAGITMRLDLTAEEGLEAESAGTKHCRRSVKAARANVPGTTPAH